MASITILRNDGREMVVPVPKGLNAHYLLRQLRRVNAGDIPAPLTEREAEWIADVSARAAEGCDGV
jgi:cytochrome c553